jgi:large subunit ribosomal protein L25
MNDRQIISGGKMILNLAVQSRDLAKKSERKTMRKSGKVPAIIYSDGQPGIPISVPTNEFYKLYKKSIGGVAIFNLDVNGVETPAVVKERQIHPVTRDLIHVDFLALHPDKELTLSVPFKFIGTPTSLKEGGSLEIALRELKVSCLPKHIPDDIPLNIEGLKIGETVYVKDLKLDNVIVKDLSSQAVILVSTPKAEKVEEETEDTEE